MTLKLRQQIVEVPAWADEHQSAVGRVVPVGGRDGGDLLAVRAERDLAELADCLDLRDDGELVGRQVHDHDGLAGVGIVDQGGRRGHRGEAVPGRAPDGGDDVPLDRLDEGRLRLVVGEVGIERGQVRDPEPGQRAILFVDLLVEALLAERLDFLRGFLAGEEGDPAAVRRQDPAADSVRVLDQLAALSAPDRDAVEGGDQILAAAGGVQDLVVAAEAGSADVHRAGDKGPGGSGLGHVEHVQFGPRAAAVLVQWPPWDAQQVGREAAVGRHLDRADAAQRGDVVWLDRVRLLGGRDRRQRQCRGGGQSESAACAGASDVRSHGFSPVIAPPQAAAVQPPSAAPGCRATA